MLAGLGVPGRIDTRYAAMPLTTMPEPLPPAIRALPPSEHWVNVHTLGVKGDGQTDDTAAIQQAIDAHRVLYFPIGYYIVRDTIVLKPDTVIIALHPATTQFDLPDSTPGFQGVGAPKALAGSAARRDQHRQRPRASSPAASIRARSSILWMAGEQSLRQRRADSRRRRHVSAAGRRDRRSTTSAPRRTAILGRSLGRAVSEHLGDPRRRRHVRQHLVAQPVRTGRLLRVRHDDARTRLRAVERASPVQRDQARSRRELGLQRAADRRGSADEPRGRLARDRRVDEHH